MNWIAFLVVLVGVPLAGMLMAMLQIAFWHAVNRYLRLDDGAQEALKLSLFAVSILGMATLAGLTL